MIERIVLPTVSPYFSVYNWHANLQSIILNHPDWSSWIYSNYIQIYMDTRPEITFTDFFLNNGLIHTASCPFVEQNSISRKIISKVTGLINFIVECIRNENYIYLLADISKIPHYSVHSPRYHEIFLYGFDIELELIFIADYIQGKYIQFSASFKEIEEAINGANDKESDHLQHIETWKYLPKSNYSFDIIHVRNQIFEYVNCVNSSDKYRQKATPHPFRTFGLNVFHIIINHLQDVQNSKGWLDIRPFYLLYTRYKLMCDRLKYMEENKYIGNIDGYFETYLKLSRLAQISSNLVLKHQCTKNSSIISNIQKKVQMICNEDKETSEKLLLAINKLI